MQLRATALASSLLIAIVSLSACGSARSSFEAQSGTVTQTASAQAAAAAYDFDMEIFHPVEARNGMVTSEQELATRIGVNSEHSQGRR